MPAWRVHEVRGGSRRALAGSDGPGARDTALLAHRHALRHGDWKGFDEYPDIACLVSR